MTKTKTLLLSAALVLGAFSLVEAQTSTRTLVLSSQILSYTGKVARTIFTARNAYTVPDSTQIDRRLNANGGTTTIDVNIVLFLHSVHDIELVLTRTKEDDSTETVTLVGRFFVLPGAANYVITNKQIVTTTVKLIYS